MDRVPPHNLDAEASLLGAAMLAPTALEILATQTTPGDFYRPAYRHIAHVLTRAHAEGWPADAVTVADELARTGLLEQVGGPATLATLLASTPSTTAAARYASIVHDHATLRRLIEHAGETAELASHRDPLEVLEWARKRLETIHHEVRSSDPLAHLPFADVGALLDGDDLEPERPGILTRADGAGLLYAGKMNTLQAEPSTGKTWIALLAALEVLSMGGTVLYLDWEDLARSAVSRLRSLGAPMGPLRNHRFKHLRPTERGTLNRELVAAAAALKADLVIMDSVAEALNACGYSEDRSEEYLAWLNELARPIADNGAAVVLLDHVVKSKDDRGRWARGSGAKLGAVNGAALSIRSTGFSQHTEGRMTLRNEKDRPGGLDYSQGQDVASIRFVPHLGGRRITVTIERPLPTPDPLTPEQKASLEAHREDQQADEIAARILKVLDGSKRPLSRSQIKNKMRAEDDDGKRFRFSDKLFPVVVEELKSRGQIVASPGRGDNYVYALPPRQQSLEDPQ